jgi:hypothetical protein
MDAEVKRMVREVRLPIRRDDHESRIIQARDGWSVEIQVPLRRPLRAAVLSVLLHFNTDRVPLLFDRGR